MFLVSVEKEVLTFWLFTSLPFSAEDSAHIQDHYTLLERQIIIEVRLLVSPFSASMPVLSAIQPLGDLYTLLYMSFPVTFSKSLSFPLSMIALFPPLFSGILFLLTCY